MNQDYSDDELEKKLQEIEKEEPGDKEKRSSSQAVRLMELFYSQNPTVFQDQFCEGYVRIPLAHSFEILPCESSRFEKYLRRLIWEEESTSISAEALKQVVALITAKAQFEGEVIELSNRVASFDGSFWYDLCNGQSVHVNRGLWSVRTETPVLFRSHSHQANQVLPVSGQGDIRRLLKHVRLSDPSQQCLFLVWVITALIPQIPHPVLVLFGEKGAAKSTTLRFARRLVDPSKLELLSLPAHDELVQQLSHHYGAFYDNVGTISRFISDALCRAVTGEGTSKRKLYSNNDDVVYNYRRVVALNGINNVVEAADLLDRSILIELKRVSKNERMTEKELDEAFEKDRPYILAGVFDALAEACKHIDEVKLDALPRMADFARWGFAISEALGYGGHFFLEAYDANIERQNEEAIEASPVAQVLRRFMEHQSHWEGSSTELLQALDPIMDDLKIRRAQWPSQANVLSRRINEVKSNLLDIGIEAEHIRDSRCRRWRLSKSIVTTDMSVTDRLEVSDGGDDGDEDDGDTFIYDVSIASSIDQVRKRLDDDSDDNDGILGSLLSPKANDFFSERVSLEELNSSEFVEVVSSVFGPGTKVS